jgi:hypothetical protein
MPQSAQTADPYASIAAPAPADPYASIATPIPPAQAGVVDRSIEGAKQFAAPIMDLMKPPETPTEQLVHAIGGGGGALAAYRTAKNIVSSVDNAVKSTPAQYKQAAADVQRAVQDFHNEDYRNALSDAVSAGAGVGVVPGGQATRELSEGARPGGNLATPLTRDALIAGTALIGGEAAAPEEAAAGGAEAAEAADVTSLSKVNPFRVAKEITQGKDVAQAPATSAIREGVSAGDIRPTTTLQARPTPIVEGNQSILDEPLKALKSQESKAYSTLDKTAGFDLKALKDQVSNDEYSIKQLGSTADDMVKRTNLQTAINNAKTRITDAEAKLTKAGVDPKAGDALHTSRMAGEDLKRIIVRNTTSDGSVNIDPLLKQTQALRFVKRGDRLAQFMGKDAADQFINDLQAAQKAGVHAMKVQKFAKWAAGVAATTAGLAEGGHIVAQHLLGG